MRPNLAIEHCINFVNDEVGMEDITYEDVRLLLDYIKQLEEESDKYATGAWNKMTTLNLCKHGYEDWSDCPDCGH